MSFRSLVGGPVSRLPRAWSRGGRSSAAACCSGPQQPVILTRTCFRLAGRGGRLSAAACCILVGGPTSGSPAAEDGCQRLHPAAAPGPRHIQPGLAPQRSGTFDKFAALCEDIGLLKESDISQISTSLGYSFFSPRSSYANIM